ncbi:MAG: hypothetical protein IKJ27_12150 [Clostridia bacterium]|nr:hypothetical protein [Clostridia bacterium]
MMRTIKNGFKIIGYTDEFMGKIKVYNDKRKQVGEISKLGTKYSAKDTHFRLIAEYDERTNETKDAHFRRIGKGNILVEMLLKNG